MYRISGGIKIFSNYVFLRCLKPATKFNNLHFTVKSIVCYSIMHLTNNPYPFLKHGHTVMAIHLSDYRYIIYTYAKSVS